MKANNNKTDEIANLISMIESCFTYGGIEENSYNYKRYILPYAEILGKKTFNKIYKQQEERLQGYKVISNVYTDSEGCTYNSLVKK